MAAPSRRQGARRLDTVQLLARRRPCHHGRLSPSFILKCLYESNGWIGHCCEMVLSRGMDGGVFATSNAIGIGTRRNGKWIILFSSPISPIHERQRENECSHEPSTIIIPPHDDHKQLRDSWDASCFHRGHGHFVFGCFLTKTPSNDGKPQKFLSSTARIQPTRRLLLLFLLQSIMTPPHHHHHLLVHHNAKIYLFVYCGRHCHQLPGFYHLLDTRALPTHEELPVTFRDPTLSVIPDEWPLDLRHEHLKFITWMELAQ